MRESTSEREEPAEPATVIRSQVDAWRERLEEHRELADDADEKADARRHRGRAEALQQGIRRLEAGDLEAAPVEAVGRVSSRLFDRSRELSRLIEERAPLEGKHRAIRDELATMRRELADVQERLSRVLEEDELPHPDDWEWVSEDVRERVLEAWGYEG